MSKSCRKCGQKFSASREFMNGPVTVMGADGKPMTLYLDHKGRIVATQPTAIPAGPAPSRPSSKRR